MTPRTRLRSIAKWAAVTCAIAAGLVVVAAVVAPLVIRGERFGRLATRMLPQTRGRIQVGSGQWSWGAVLALYRERPAALALEDVRIVDPEGTEVLRAGRISARVELHRAPLRVVVHDLRVEDADWRYAQMKTEKRIGFLAALAPTGAAQSQPRPRIAGGGAEISIAGARLEGVTATFEFSAWGLALRDVHGDAGLAARAGGGAPASFGFDVSGAEARGGGRLRILGGRRAFALPFTRARLDRVATAADAPDSIRLDASEVATGRSRLTIAGAFDGVYGVSAASRRPGLSLEARFEDAADAVVALAASAGLRGTPALGAGARATVRFVGPFARLAVEAKLESAALGRLAVDATATGHSVVGGFAFTGFALGALLPRSLAPLASGALDGRLRGAVELDGSVALDELALLLTRPASASGPRFVRARAGGTSAPGPRGPAGWGLDLSGLRYAAGTIHLPRVAFPLLGGRISAGGSIALRDPREKGWLDAPSVDLALRGDGLSLEKLLGVRFVTGVTTFRARVRGPIHDLALELDLDLPGRQGLTVLGERFGLPPRVMLRLADETLSFEGVRLTGPDGCVLEGSGRVATTGRLGIGIVVRDFPIARLPGLSQTALPVAGRISGKMELEGEAGAPRISGQLALDAVTFEGHALGGGSLAITPGPRGAIRAHGRLIDGITADGTLTPAPTGLSGEASLVLDRLRLDPFVPALPGGLTAAGSLSGRLVARLEPRRPVLAEGQLSELTLLVTPPARGRRPARPIALHTDGAVPLSARTGGGPIVVGPARFVGDAGVFSLSGESRGDDLRATVRGRFELAPFAPLASEWLDALAGAVDVELGVTRAAPAGRPAVEGSVSIATPLALRPAAVPLDLRVPSGRILIHGATVETTGLPITVRADRLADGMVRQLAASARVDAHVAGLPGAPSARASLFIDRLTAQVPLLGPAPLTCEHGAVGVESRGERVELVRVDLPARGELRGVASAGTRVDDASFALRLRGDPRRRLSLSGDVQLADVKTSTKALGAQAKAAAGGGTTSASTPSWARRPEVQNTELDLHVRSRGGAVAVDVPHAPDLRVDVDMHVGGTIKHPAVSGEPRGANLYSSFVLGLRRLFR